MPKKIRGLIALAIISASMICTTGCDAGSTGKEAPSVIESGGNASTDNAAQIEEGYGSGADAAGSTVTSQSITTPESFLRQELITYLSFRLSSVIMIR